MPATATAVRPGYRPYVVEVTAVRRLAPHFVRISLSGDALRDFGLAGLDQRIKVVLPHADGSWGDFGQGEGDGEWFARWRALPPDSRNVFRTYTVRRIDPTVPRLDIDFVVHHGAGPAGTWAEDARVGDRIVVVGPDERSPQSRIGIDWHPGTARRLLLAGDETAAPAICAILESLPSTVDVDAFVEVPTSADVLPLDVPPGFRVHWLGREDRAHGELLTESVTGWALRSADVLARASAPRPQRLEDIDLDRELLWDSPEEGVGEFYAWMAGESSTIKALRRHLVSECGIDRRRVAFMGYWRRGQDERIG